MSELQGYETVKARKKRWYKDYPDGSLNSEIFFFEKGHIVVKGYAYRNKEEQEKKLPSGTGIAEEYQSNRGANKFAWTENCDESAIGRALDNAGYSNGSCSKEEMNKVEQHEEDEQHEEKIKAKLAPLLVQLQSIMVKQNINAEKMKDFSRKKYGVGSSKKLSEKELRDLIARIENGEVK